MNSHLVNACSTLDFDAVICALSNGEDATVTWSALKQQTTPQKQLPVFHNLITAALMAAEDETSIGKVSKIAKILVKHGADINFYYIEDNARKATPLGWIVRWATKTTPLLEYESLVELANTFITLGANPNLPLIFRNCEQSLLQLACEAQCFRALTEMLVLAGANINECTSLQMVTPFFLALENRLHANTIQLMLACGADCKVINMRSKRWFSKDRLERSSIYNALIAPQLVWNSVLHKVLSPILRSRINALLLCFLRLNLPLCSMEFPGTRIILTAMVRDYVRDAIYTNWDHHILNSTNENV